MPVDIVKDGIKIRKIKTGEREHLAAYMPNGEIIPFVSEVRVISEVGSLVKVELTVIIEPDNIEI